MLKVDNIIPLWRFVIPNYWGKCNPLCRTLTKYFANFQTTSSITTRVTWKFSKFINFRYHFCSSLGMKDSWGPLKALAVASIVDGIGHLVLCTFLGYGIVGAAWSTMASQVFFFLSMSMYLISMHLYLFIPQNQSPSSPLWFLGYCGLYDGRSSEQERIQCIFSICSLNWWIFVNTWHRCSHFSNHDVKGSIL